VAGKDSHGFIGSDPNTGYANTVRAERYLGRCAGAFVASSGCSCFSCRGRGVALGRHGRGGAYRVEGVQRRPRRAAVRPRRGPAGLVGAWRSDDLAVGDPPTGQPAGAADRVVVRVNFGGPGVAGVATVKRLGPRLNRLGRGRFDVVSWDPRGVGESTRISCFANDRDQLRFWGAFAMPVTSAQSKRLVRRTTAFARRCTERNRGLIPFLSTADTVRDLDHLRELVGDAQLNYRGISYGTFIGQTYANIFPDRVRAMVLDGNINPFAFTRSVQAAIGSSIIDADRVIGRKFFELCRRAGPARCALARGGSPARRFARLLARLRRGPIPAPAADPPRLSYSDLLIRIFLAEGAPAGWPDFARELDRAARGDGSAMAQMVQGARPLLEDALNSAVGLQCADKPVPPLLGPEAWPEVIRRLARVSYSNGPIQGWWLWAPCAAWKIPAANRYAGPWTAATPNPVLVIGTRYDPRTSYQSSVVAARALGNAVLLTHDGYGHTSDEDPSACIQRRVAAYLTGLATPPPATVCRSDHLPFSRKFGPSLG
jgi:pimeloyl-ACP methyl ester carboxylesterase